MARRTEGNRKTRNDGIEKYRNMVYFIVMRKIMRVNNGRQADGRQMDDAHAPAYAPAHPRR